MRKEPDVTPPANITHRELNIIEQKRTYQLITPLYGGGVEPNEADPVTIVRATEIRGQLRFWWRATRGGKSEGDSDMKAGKMLSGVKLMKRVIQVFHPIRQYRSLLMLTHPDRVRQFRPFLWQEER